MSSIVTCSSVPSNSSSFLQNHRQDPEKMALFTYRPPIQSNSSWRKREVTVFYSNGEVFAELLENGDQHQLPIKGYPPALSKLPDLLKRFFSSSYLTVEKRTNGDYSYVRANLKLKGGMISQQDVLPMYPGYAIGSIIKKNDLLLPLYDKKRMALENDLSEIHLKKAELLESSLYKRADKGKQQAMLINKNAEIAKIDKEYEEICQRLNELYEKKEFHLAVEETLPIDTKYSKISIEDRSFASERMAYLIFKRKENDSSKQDLIELQFQVEKFVSRLFSQDAPSNFLPSSTLEGVVSGIRDMLETESLISLVGSFVTLPRVRIMDPVVIRDKARISDTLKKNSREYYVLTEAVLGAVFLGFGKYISRTGQDSKSKKIEESTPSVMSKFSTVSFISQGVIPKPSKDAEDVNLWSVYTHWKEVLQSDPNSGYPIGFKFRELQDILLENNVPLEVEEKSQ